MATRMYFNTTTQTAQSQTINSAWTGAYSTFARYFFETTATSAFSTLTSTQTMAINESYCYGQWWTHPISNFGSFTSADWNASTWTFLMRHSENNAADNLVYKAQLRIWSGGTFINNSFFTGGTEYDVGNGATTNGLMESRRCSLCDFWGAIGPFSNGDRLVLEVGTFRTASAAASTTDYTEIGGNSGTDMTNSETVITQQNPYLECSLNFTFDAEPVAGAGTNQLMQVGGGT